MGNEHGSEKPGGAAAWPAWKKAAFAIAAVVLLLGVGLRVYAHARPAPPVTAAGEKPGGAPKSGLVAPGGGSTGTAAEPAKPSPAEVAAPILTASGLSFFVAYCVGMALRAVAKTAMIVLGLGALVLIGLQAAGLAPPVNWSALEGPFASMGGFIEKIVGSVDHALGAVLPSAGMAGFGLASGLKKTS
jgi:uncharacterized membrane protein (Fun14 family)